MKEKTIFEKIIDREIPSAVIYEDDEVFAFLDAFPFEKGHILVIPKKPHATIFDMSESEYMYLQKHVYLIANHVREKTKKDVVIYQKNGVDAGQEVPHVHVHIIPRYHAEMKKGVFSEEEHNRFGKGEDSYFKEFGDLLKM